ncbi:MAG: alpha/beta hydrolase [Gordonia sp. (in: high G+C Gram-positive bacteria)]|uniref:alpha/beta fold hydrolase n=1 Tax=Gordonia sp. (in: high G+C Gram-positive bacteria) TaxID=84139 RepID=UPI003C707766
MTERQLITTASDTTIAATRVGDGPTVLLSGGLGMPSGVWQFTGIPNDLVKAGFSVITYSARGVTPSSAPPAPYSVPEMADDAVAVLNHFEVDDAILAGYSMGCYVTQALASAWPGHVRGVAMLAGLRSSAIGEIVNDMELGLLDRLGEIPEHVAIFEQLMTTLSPTTLSNDAAVRSWREILSSGDPVWSAPDGLKGQLSASRSWMLAKEPTDDRLAGITAPALVIAFENDLFFPPAGGREAASHLPNAEFHEIGGQAHGGVMLDPERRAAGLLVDFCSRLRTSP